MDYEQETNTSSSTSYSPVRLPEWIVESDTEDSGISGIRPLELEKKQSSSVREKLEKFRNVHEDWTEWRKNCSDFQPHQHPATEQAKISSTDKQCGKENKIELDDKKPGYIIVEPSKELKDCNHTRDPKIIPKQEPLMDTDEQEIELLKGQLEEQSDEKKQEEQQLLLQNSRQKPLPDHQDEKNFDQNAVVEKPSEKSFKEFKESEHKELKRNSTEESVSVIAPRDPNEQDFNRKLNVTEESKIVLRSKKSILKPLITNGNSPPITTVNKPTPLKVTSSNFFSFRRSPEDRLSTENNVPGYMFLSNYSNEDTESETSEVECDKQVEDQCSDDVIHFLDRRIRKRRRQLKKRLKKKSRKAVKSKTLLTKLLYTKVDYLKLIMERERKTLEWIENVVFEKHDSSTPII